MSCYDMPWICAKLTLRFLAFSVVNVCVYVFNGGVLLLLSVCQALRPVVNRCVFCCKFNKFIYFSAMKPCKTCLFSCRNLVDIHLLPAGARWAVDIAAVFHTVFHRVFHTRRNAAFRRAECGLSPSRLPSFALRKAAYCSFSHFYFVVRRPCRNFARIGMNHTHSKYR